MPPSAKNEVWTCLNCKAKNKTEPNQRTCPNGACLELRDSPLTRAEATTIYETLEDALKEAYRDLGHSLFSQTTDALKELVLEHAQDPTREVSPDHPLIGVYLEQSPGGLAALAHLGFEIDFGAVGRNDSLTIPMARDMNRRIDKVLAEVDRLPTKCEEISKAEQAFLDYYHYELTPPGARAKIGKKPVKPKNYEELATKFKPKAGGARPPSKFQKYLIQLRTDNDNKRRQIRDQSLKEKTESRLQNVMEGQSQVNMNQPCPKGDNCFVASCVYKHSANRTPVCNTPACRDQECWLLHVGHHPNLCDGQSAGKTHYKPGEVHNPNPQWKMMTEPHVNPAKPGSKPTVFPIVLGVGAKDPARFAKIECRNPVCRTYRCEFSHKFYKRVPDCPEGQLCKNLNKYLYHNQVTNALTQTPEPGAIRIQNNAFCTLIHPRDSRRLLGPDVEVDCPFWKDLKGTQLEAVRRLEESDNMKERQKLMPGESMFPGCRDCYCEYNHSDQKRRDKRYYYKFNFVNPRADNEYEEFKQGRNLVTLQDATLAGKNPEDHEDPFAALGKNSHEEIQAQRKKEKEAMNNNQHVYNDKNLFANANDKAEKPKVITQPAPPPKPMTQKFAEIAKLAKVEPTPRSAGGAGGNYSGAYGDDMPVFHTSQYTQADLDAMIAIMGGLECCTVIEDGPFLPDSNPQERPAQEEKAPKTLGELEEEMTRLQIRLSQMDGPEHLVMDLVMKLSALEEEYKQLETQQQYSPQQQQQQYQQYSPQPQQQQQQYQQYQQPQHNNIPIPTPVQNLPAPLPMAMPAPVPPATPSMPMPKPAMPLPTATQIPIPSPAAHIPMPVAPVAPVKPAVHINMTKPVPPTPPAAIQFGAPKPPTAPIPSPASFPAPVAPKPVSHIPAPVPVATGNVPMAKPMAPVAIPAPLPSGSAIPIPTPTGGMPKPMPAPMPVAAPIPSPAGAPVPSPAGMPMPKPVAAPVPSPAGIPKPVAPAPVPAPVGVTMPKPVAPAPVPAPVSVAMPKPVAPAPVPAPSGIPIPSPAGMTMPKPVAAPMPGGVPMPKPVTAPIPAAPAPVGMPKPVAAPIPSPAGGIPAPTPVMPKPVVAPIPSPAGIPAPVAPMPAAVAPVPAPVAPKPAVPAPVPVIKPAAPVPAPVAAPVPAPVAAPVPAPAPTSAPAPAPVPVPAAVPAPTAQSTLNPTNAKPFHPAPAMGQAPKATPPAPTPMPNQPPHMQQQMPMGMDPYNQGGGYGYNSYGPMNSYQPYGMYPPYGNFGMAPPPPQPQQPQGGEGAAPSPPTPGASTATPTAPTPNNAPQPPHGANPQQGGYPGGYPGYYNPQQYAYGYQQSYDPYGGYQHMGQQYPMQPGAYGHYGQSAPYGYGAQGGYGGHPQHPQQGANPGAGAPQGGAPQPPKPKKFP